MSGNWKEDPDQQQEYNRNKFDGQNEANTFAQAARNKIDGQNPNSTNPFYNGNTAVGKARSPDIKEQKVRAAVNNNPITLDLKTSPRL